MEKLIWRLPVDELIEFEHIEMRKNGKKSMNSGTETTNYATCRGKCPSVEW